MAFSDKIYEHGQYTKEIRDSNANAPRPWALGQIEILSTSDPNDRLTWGVTLSAAVADGAINKANLTFSSSVPRNKVYKVNLTCGGHPRSFRVTLQP